MDSDKLLQLTEKTFKDNVTLGLVISSAMAWNEVIKTFASKFIKNGGGEWYVVMYAVFLTLLMVAFNTISGSSSKPKKVVQL